MTKNRTFITLGAVLILAVFIILLPAQNAYANVLIPDIHVSFGDEPSEVVPALQTLFILSLIALAPSLLFLFTGFTRIVIALHFIRSAMGTQQMPPNQVMVGVALILTIFLMTPMLNELNENALQPYGRGEIATDEALERAMKPFSEFMRNQVDLRDVVFFADFSGEQFVYDPDDLAFDGIPDRIIVPAFILSELTKGFIIGFLIYMPFLVIDMVVASVLMAMGMMMLPPAMISMPFKILLFLLGGGWSYVIEFVMLTFRMGR